MTKVKKPALEEKDTLKAVGEGDREAMTEIDHRYREPIIHYVLKRQRNKLGREDRPTAEDIVQDTMWSAPLKLDTLRPKLIHATEPT